MTSSKPAVKLNTGSKKARRSAARLTASQVVYQVAMTKQAPDKVLEQFRDSRIGYQLDEEVLVPADMDVLVEIIRSLYERYDDLEAMVMGSLTSKEDEATVEPLLKSILLCGAAELVCRHEVDTPIIIADYLNVTHAFYDKGEPGLVNAVLDKIAQNIRST